jgi:hypothetical protein
VVATSGDGSSIAYLDDATNLYPAGGTAGNVFVYHPFSNALALASFVNGTRPPNEVAAGGVTISPDTDFTDLSISLDGNSVTYQSTAGNLVPGQAGRPGGKNTFVYFQPTATNTLVSRVGSSANTGDRDTPAAIISADDNTIAFVSFATNLNPGVNVRDGGANLYVLNIRTAGPLLLSSRSAFQDSASSRVYGSSADGRYAVFTSNAPNVVSGQVDNNSD